MNRKFALSVVLVMIGVIIYVAASDGPWRVRAVAVPVQIIYLLSVAYLAWVPKLDLAKRIIAICMTVMLGSAAAVWLLSFVIMALRPLTAGAIALGVVGYTLEALLFLLGVFMLDWVVGRVRPGQPHPS